MRPIAPCAFLLLTLVSACVEENQPIRHPERMSVWVQNLPAGSLVESISFCETNHLNLNVNMMQGEWDAEALAELCAEAAAHDVAIRLWPALPHADGYWANQENAEIFVAYVDEILSWVPDACPRLDGIMYDMEMPFDRFSELSQMQAEGKSNLDIINWLLAGSDEERFIEAREIFANSVERVHNMGLTASVSTLPQNADDYADGDETVARAMWTPIEGIAWDSIAFQVYRNLFQLNYPPTDGSQYSSGLITSYAQSVKEAFGDKGALDLGMAGGPRIEDGLGEARELQADIAAARAAGLSVGALSIFALDGLRRLEDAADWVSVPEPKAAEPTTADESLRAIFRLLDSLEY